MPKMQTSPYADQVVARKLDNGMTVTIERLPHVHSASAGIWIKTGSANEAEGHAGISHFLEHLFFKGTTTRNARQIIEPIECTGGHLNAFTSREYTCIYFKTLDKHIATGIEILADVIKNSTFADLEKERNVVLEEIASIEDVPEDYAHDLLAEYMWPDHALGRPVSGYDRTVSKFSLDDVHAYFKTWYHPRKMYFSIAGSFDERAVLDQIYQAFGTLSPRAAAKPLDAPAFHSGIRVVERDIAQNHLCVGFPGPTVTDARRYTYDILCCALGGGSTSRLFQRIREDEGLAYSIYSSHSAYFTAGAFNVYAAVAPESFEKTLALSFEEIRRFREEPMTEQELEINREHLKGSLLISLESTFNRMARMAKSMMYYKRMLSIEEILASLDAVTIEDIRQLAQEIFQPERCAIIVLGPTNVSALKEIPL